MTDAHPDPFSEARALMHGQAAESRRRNEGIRTLAESIEATTATARSKDGTISVTASTSGVIVAIDITNAGLDDGASALSAELVLVIAAAQRAALKKAAEISAEELGSNHPLVADLEHSASRFGGSEPSAGYR